MNPGQFILVTLFSMLGATAQGSIGIGYGMVAGAGLVAIDPSFVPGPLLIIGVIISVRHAVVEREHLDRGIWLRAMVGLPVGLFSGLAVLNAMSDRALGLAVGAAIAVASVALLLGLSVRRNPVMDVLAGGATAFAAVTASLPGPPLVVALNDLRPGAMRATTSAFLLVLTVVSFISLSATGNFQSEEYELLAFLVPGTILGLFASRYVRPYLEAAWFRPLILCIAGIGGVALILRNL